MGWRRRQEAKSRQGQGPKPKPKAKTPTQNAQLAELQAEFNAWNARAKAQVPACVSPTNPSGGESRMDSAIRYERASWLSSIAIAVEGQPGSNAIKRASKRAWRHYERCEAFRRKRI